MQSRRDLLQAHLFVVGRTVSALVRAEPDAVDTPMRRGTTASYAGVMIAVLLVAGFAIFGFISPGGKSSFRDPKAVIVEKDTGASYLFLDGRLRPVLNVASARLVLGDAKAKVRSVSSASLRGVPHGLPVGIPGAPDALPDPKRLDRTPWLVCSTVTDDDTGQPRPVVRLDVGTSTPVTALGDGDGLVVRSPDDETFLAWQDRRLRVTDRSALVGLGYDGVTPFPVGSSWINAVPAGPDLEAPDIAGRGDSGPVLGDTPTRVGQVLTVRGPGTTGDFFVVRDDGLSPASATDAALILADPRSQEAYPGQAVTAVEHSAATLAAAPRSATSSVTAGYPPTPPKALAPAGSGGTRVPCARAVLGSGQQPRIEVSYREVPPGQQLPGPGSPGSEPGSSTGSGEVADVVTVAPGAGVLAQDLPAPGVETGAMFLITDTGARFPIPSQDALTSLGFDAVTPLPVPSSLLSLLPTGPALDPAAAQQSLPLTPGTPLPAATES